jgi:hypothetical protein
LLLTGACPQAPFGAILLILPEYRARARAMAGPVRAILFDARGTCFRRFAHDGTIGP